MVIKRKEWAPVSTSRRRGGARSHQTRRNVYRTGKRQEGGARPLKRSDGILLLCGFVAFPAFLLPLPTCVPTAFITVLPVGLPHPKSRFGEVQESSYGENVKEIVQQEPLLGLGEGRQSVGILR